MKIAILSMQRVINYGSFLQAYSLKRILESWGHSVQFLDIMDKTGSIDYIQQYNVPELQFQVKKMVRRLLRPSYYYASFERLHLFYRELFPTLGIEQPMRPDQEKYDLLIIGSDEIFNCCQTDSPFENSAYLFGKGVNATRKISYAASFGNTTIDKLRNADLSDAVSAQLSQLNAICVRDQNSYEIVNELTGKESVICVDPVFLSDYQERIPKKVRHTNYLLVYGYDGRIAEPEIISSVQLFARERKLTIIGIGMAQKWCDLNIVVDPFELLAYFRDAEYIVTDTFHGTVFSIKFQKRFAAVIRDSNQQKLGYLLESFNLLSRVAAQYKQIPEILTAEYSKNDVTQLIQAYKEKGLNYLASEVESQNE